MAPTFCNRCGDAIEEGCDPRDELAELDALMERLRLKRYNLTRKINRLHSPIVRQLPPDITSTIFEFCLPDFTDHQLSYHTKGNISIPLSLGAICSYWRDIAWSTPGLWSSLVVRIRSKHDSHTVTGITEEWLARSGQLPLSIRILSTFDNKSVPALADIINQYSTRWFDLDLDMPLHCYQHFHATDNHAPILKSIRFQCSDSLTRMMSMNLNFQLTCPHLERVNFMGFSMGRTNIQWDNLTHLTIHSTSITDSLLILLKAPRLVFCKVSGFCSHFEEDGIGAPVLTSLRSLQLLIASVAAKDFLDNLIAPHLEEFSLPSGHVPSIRVITSFLRRSACSLRSFTVIDIFLLNFEDFMFFLQSLPSLNSLSMLVEDIAEDYSPPNILQLVAKVLSSQSTSLQQGFLPNLKILEYTGKLHPHPGNYDDLYPLLSADNTVHSPFHLLKLNITQHRIPKNIISCLSRLVERGITVNVLSGSNDIFQSSIDYYSLREDYLYRDWTDNFDSSLFSWLLWGISHWKVKVNVNTCYLDHPIYSDKLSVVHIRFKSWSMCLLNKFSMAMLKFGWMVKMIFCGGIGLITFTRVFFLDCYRKVKRWDNVASVTDCQIFKFKSWLIVF